MRSTLKPKVCVQGKYRLPEPTERARGDKVLRGRAVLVLKFFWWCTFLPHAVSTVAQPIQSRCSLKVSDQPSGASPRYLTFYYSPLANHSCQKWSVRDYQPHELLRGSRPTLSEPIVWLPLRQKPILTSAYLACAR